MSDQEKKIESVGEEPQEQESAREQEGRDGAEREDTSPPELPASKKPSLWRRIRTNRKLRYGGISAVLTIVVVAVAALANIAVTALEDRYNLRLDMTRNKMFSLTDTTFDVLADLDRDIVITTLYRTGNENPLVTEMLAKYAARSPHITVRNIDPVRNPSYGVKFAADETVTIGEGYVVVSNPDETKYRTISSYQFYQSELNEETFESTVTGYQGEQVVTNAIVYVAAENTPTIYYLQGHLERPDSSFSALKSTLESLNYAVSSMTNVGRDGVALKPKDVLVVASPGTDLSDDERDLVKDFLLKGGRMIYFADANAPDLPNFESLFELFGVRFNHDLAIDNDDDYYFYDNTYIAPDMASHDITASLNSNRLYSLLANSMSFVLPDLPRNNVVVEPLLTTSASSFGRVDPASEALEPAAEDIIGPLTLGVAITNKDFDNPENDAQIVLFGTSTFITDLATMAQGNRYLYLNSVAWMSDQTDSVYIRAKSLSEPTLSIASQGQLIWILVIVIFILPGIVLAAAITVFLRRRHL